jgi:superfamily II DNA or RNA helicase
VTRSDAVLDEMRRAQRVLAEHGPLATDGAWLEELTVTVGKLLADWDVESVYGWGAWPDREQHFPDSTEWDTGIDLVARRRSDGAHIAIQCKARKLNAAGRGSDIQKDEFDSFGHDSAGAFWSERWLVTNGSVDLSGQAAQSNLKTDRPVKLVNLTADVSAAIASSEVADTECEHCAGTDVEGAQTKSCMQREAVERSVRQLRDHAGSDTGGLPVGQARGRIILPCGTGKSRVALRIIEELTAGGELSVVLCPSIALVAQLRREFLNHAHRGMRALAVCSDRTAGYDPKLEGAATRADDPTRDTSNVSARELKGHVTTDAVEIAEWIRVGRLDERISVIFGTYQSAGRVATALRTAEASVQVLVADEAHRTASLRRRRRAEVGEDARLREFTLCHDQDELPARYRVYQTATPRIYNYSTSARRVDPGEFVVRSMDDESTFGVELYRRSYVDAVRNGWLADYRIIALGVSDPEAYKVANELAHHSAATGRSKLTTVDHVRGLALALAMAGGTRTDDERSVDVNSCIAFMNTVNKSKNMAANLQTDAVRGWLRGRLGEREPARFTLEHLDASNNVAQRDGAKQRLADAGAEKPHGILNVGIFGEGTDSPSLGAVAFLEPRRSPIDVVQAVGRAMRTSPGKKLGYVICPVLIPPTADPEQWLSTAHPEEGWAELGQILLALRAHDDRIENELAGLLRISIPRPEPGEAPQTVTLVAAPRPESGRIEYGVYRGTTESAYEILEAAVAGGKPLRHQGVEPVRPDEWTAATEPTQVLTAATPASGEVQLRVDTVKRDKPRAGEARGDVNADRTKKLARKMINDGEGRRVPPKSERDRRKRRAAEQRHEEQAQQMLDLVGSDVGTDITMNLLARSGLRRDRVARDLNILEASVAEAAHHLSSDELRPVLDAHFGLDHLEPDNRKGHADGCTIAALLLMNAAMLHQRIAAGAWLRGVEPLSDIKNSTDPRGGFVRNWERIRDQDFVPVIKPAREVIYSVEQTGRLAGLERALRHLAAEAERIAATYADMGADHAGPLFNKVMGNQAADGAYFTRPPAATMAARLALDACESTGTDWLNESTWLERRAVDLACGSGTLLAALLADMKRRARDQGATERRLAQLQKRAVEDVLAGMDINAVSLQLAATQLTAGNTEIRYARMGLYLMPHGPTGDAVVPTAAGTLELLAEESVLPRGNQRLFTGAAKATALRMNFDALETLGDPEVSRAAEAALGARIAIMNPPFTNRSKMGEKFTTSTQHSLRGRVDELESQLVAGDGDLDGFVDKNSIAPLFMALAERCVDPHFGVLAVIHPTIALTNASGVHERRVLAARFDVDTVLTCHQPGNINLSQDTNINESIVVLRRRAEAPPPPRIASGQVHQPRPIPDRRLRGCRTVRLRRCTRCHRHRHTAGRLGRGVALAC